MIVAYFLPSWTNLGKSRSINPITLPLEARVGDALALFQLRRISELPVIDGDGRPVGLLDITDLIGVAAEEGARGAGLARVGA